MSHEDILASIEMLVLVLDRADAFLSEGQTDAVVAKLLEVIGLLG